MYQLHIAEKHLSSWSLRAWLLLRALAIPFAETLHRYQPDDLAAQRRAWLAFSPTSKVPVLVDGATVVWDSLAITEYVAEAHPQVWPQDQPARAWARINQLWNEGLQCFGGPFLAGADFSAVDAFYAPVAMRLQCYQLNGCLNGAAADYAQRLLNLPEMRQWCEEAAV